ncbi:hypothetical protein LCGC14_1126440 [marine sediment metagenome]|uniref:Uncharacterized protein n=1 Tax=marine sediment metagenome TaxID=412755 RepID=A0A0F9PKI0_9ZZZZ
MKITHHDEAKNLTITVGDYDEQSLTFTADRTGNRFNIYNGYGIQEDSFKELMEMGCREIIITDGKDEYHSPLYRWVEKGIISDWGHGKQRFLPVRYMRDVNDKQVALL